MPKKQTNRKKRATLSPEQKRLKAVLEGEKRLLKKHSIARFVALVFPNKKNNKVPFISKIAYKIIRLQGGQIGVRYQLINKK